MILELLFPYKCPVCETIAGGKTPRLCEACRGKLETEMNAPCPVCSRSAADCRCLPPMISALPFPDDALAFLSFGWYDPKRFPVGAKLVYRLKHSDTRDPSFIFANAMAGHIRKYLTESGEDPSDWFVTFPPRTNEARYENGFDQAQRLTGELARLLGAKRKNVFRRRGGRVQKTLDKSGRKENAESSLVLRWKRAVRGKKVIVCDDVVTTGATVAQCVRLLYLAGAEKVLAVSALRTPPRKSAPPRPFWL